MTAAYLNGLVGTAQFVDVADYTRRSGWRVECVPEVDWESVITGGMLRALQQALWVLP